MAEPSLQGCIHSVFWRAPPTPASATHDLPRAANRAVGISRELHFTPLHFPGIQNQQSAHKWSAYPGKHFNSLHRLNRANHSNEWCDHTSFGTGQVFIALLRVQTVITGGFRVPAVIHTNLALTPDRCAGNQRDTCRHTSAVQGKPRGKVIRTI